MLPVVFGRDLAVSDESEAALQVTLAEQDLPVVTEPFAPGDASFHLGWTFHHAGSDTAADPRRVMTAIYIDADMVAAEPVNKRQVGNLATSLPAAGPGEPAASPLEPVLYRR